MSAARSLLLACSLLAVAARAPQEDAASSVRQADDLYPAVKVEEVVRFVVVRTDEPQLGDLKDALKELGAAVVYGPRTTQARPGRAFFAVRLPWSVSARELERAARKAGGAADALACTAFEGREGRDQAIDVGPLSFTSRDFVMGISGEIVWFDSIGGWSQFYGAPGKIDAEDVAERYIQLYAPYGGGSLGRVVEERFTWTLKSVPDGKQEAKLLKAIAKLDGVTDVALAGAALSVQVRLEDVPACAPAGALSKSSGEEDAFDAAGLAAPRAAWCTRPLWDLLEAQGLAP
jgi:hypothetical protein